LALSVATAAVDFHAASPTVFQPWCFSTRAVTVDSQRSFKLPVFTKKTSCYLRFLNMQETLTMAALLKPFWR
jgi:hypothetical protein